MRKGIRHWLGRIEKALLGRTLIGRKLERTVRDRRGRRLFEKGQEIDRQMLEEAREKDRLEEVAHAAEPGTSDSELEELLWWRKHRHDDMAPPGER